MPVVAPPRRPLGAAQQPPQGPPPVQAARGTREMSHHQVGAVVHCGVLIPPQHRAPGARAQPAGGAPRSALSPRAPSQGAAPGACASPGGAQLLSYADPMSPGAGTARSARTARTGASYGATRPLSHHSAAQVLNARLGPICSPSPAPTSALRSVSAPQPWVSPRSAARSLPPSAGAALSGRVSPAAPPQPAAPYSARPAPARPPAAARQQQQRSGVMQPPGAAVWCSSGPVRGPPAGVVSPARLPPAAAAPQLPAGALDRGQWEQMRAAAERKAAAILGRAPGATGH
eukprot:TRINITY_DN7502_c0_g1_i1.p2 TRINITY_DN7502_c0_g1~~TRINITY_DN7502_c0_g1_i1.p2  ORF type:complete len:318 (+),score=71.25 TRINITY_DN7502_c0_g1_i1:91-954(+)